MTPFALRSQLIIYSKQKSVELQDEDEFSSFRPRHHHHQCLPLGFPRQQGDDSRFSLIENNNIYVKTRDGRVKR